VRKNPGFDEHGSYLQRANCPEGDPARFWQWYPVPAGRSRLSHRQEWVAPGFSSANRTDAERLGEVDPQFGLFEDVQQAVFKKRKCVHHWAVQVAIALEGQGN
jgi:hypothetical protein